MTSVDINVVRVIGLISMLDPDVIIRADNIDVFQYVLRESEQSTETCACQIQRSNTLSAILNLNSCIPITPGTLIWAEMVGVVLLGSRFVVLRNYRTRSASSLGLSQLMYSLGIRGSKHWITMGRGATGERPLRALASKRRDGPRRIVVCTEFKELDMCSIT
jgi:hypothetical protein